MRVRTRKIYQPGILDRQHFVQEQSFRALFRIRSCDFVDRNPGTKDERSTKLHENNERHKHELQRENLELTLSLWSSYFASSSKD